LRLRLPVLSHTYFYSSFSLFVLRFSHYLHFLVCFSWEILPWHSFGAIGVIGEILAIDVCGCVWGCVCVWWRCKLWHQWHQSYGTKVLLVLVVMRPFQMDVKISLLFQKMVIHIPVCSPCTSKRRRTLSNTYHLPIFHV
jgi:hypothetical protein